MNKKSWALVFIVMLPLLGIMAYLNRHDPGMPMTMGLVLLTVIVVFAIFASPRTLAFIKTHPKAIRNAGIVVIVFGFVLMGALSTYTEGPIEENSWQMGIPLVVMVLGCLLISLPSSAKHQVDNAQMKAEIKASEGLFDGREQAIAASGFVLEHWQAFLRIAWPWILIYSLAPPLAMQYAALSNGTITNFLDSIPAKPNEDAAIAFILTYAAIMIISLPVVMMAWSRYVQRMELPRHGIALPEKYFFTMALILWVVLNMSGRISDMIGAGTADIAKTSAVAGEMIQWALWLIILLGVSLYALLLPARAVQDSEPNLFKVPYMAMRLGRPYIFGFVLALLPFGVVSFLLRKATEAVAGSSISAAMFYSIVPDVFYFAALAATATYLSRAYIIAKQLPPPIPA